MPFETPLIESWLQSTLSAGTALTALVGGSASPCIYPYLINQGKGFPAVVFSLQSELDDNAINGNRAAIEADYLIKAVSQDSTYLSNRQIMSQVDALIALKPTKGTVFSGTVPVLFILDCVRKRTVQYTTVEDGVRYNHAGAVYHITAENA